ncbi:39S ribosomal protein L41, mitochondrial [Araneus ventricosus]|uniref:39S ribosomal protein L41, mitochondrial n=1 Tax=Araneus ventricosus TaxID=182803 RepID=A0A4Y2FSU4_ARAVE|nr:39S ribosomal protein L41, mitochondrial [Araneus ventricosus]
MIPERFHQLFKLSHRFKLCLVHSKLQIEVSRTISTSSPSYGKRNFRKFNVANRGTYEDLKYFEEHPELEDQRGRRLPGYWEGSKFVREPEMVPELVVPDLKDFPLKPYVSYRTADIEQEKFTAEHLFYAAYYKKLKKDFEEGKLDEDGNSLEPSPEEKMDAEEAWKKARSTGSDLFG